MLFKTLPERKVLASLVRGYQREYRIELEQLEFQSYFLDSDVCSEQTQHSTLHTVEHD